MNEIIVIDVVIAALLIIFLIIRKFLFKEEYPYYKNPHFKTDIEKAFFKVLKLATGNKYLISCQVSLMSLLRINKKGKERQIYFNKISRKSVDFVLLDKETLNPVLAIELDDSTHLWINRQERDQFVNELFISTRIPLLRIKNQLNYDVTEIEKQMKKFIYTLDKLHEH